MEKKLELYEGEEQQKRVGTVMRSLIRTKPSKAPKKLAKSDAKGTR